MNLERRRLLAMAVLLPVASARAASGEFPDKPVRLVVPFPPGGGADNLARAIMPKVSLALGKPIIIDNKPGAGGNVGAEVVAGSPPDGYTLLYGTNGTHSINQSLYRNLRFDPIRDFAPVSRMLNDDPATFDPDLYDDNGKYMDGWESRRKRVSGHDYAIIRLAMPGRIFGFDVDTRFFTGNYPPHGSIEAAFVESGDPTEATVWTELVALPHSSMRNTL